MLRFQTKISLLTESYGRCITSVSTVKLSATNGETVIVFNKISLPPLVFNRMTLQGFYLSCKYTW